MIEWFNDNENRPYPIEEGATGTALSGVQLPFDVLADLSISVPRDIVDDVYISMVGLTSTLKTISISTATEGLLVGTFSSPEPHTVLALEPLVDNVSGFVAWGSYRPQAVREIYEFSGLAASKVTERAVRGFDNLPVTSVARLNGNPDQLLRGLVNLQAGANVSITSDGTKITVSLREDVQEDFVGPCDRDSAFTSCGRTPIRTINGVGPDGTGRILIEVE
jgi:hypothetical protein